MARNKITPDNPSGAGPGRPKGAQNKITKQLKEMILGALDDAGGQSYLLIQARDNPNAFLTLVGKVLPMTLAGDKDNPVAFKAVGLIPVSAAHDAKD